MNGTGTDHGKLVQNRRKILGNTLANTAIKMHLAVSYTIKIKVKALCEGFYFL